MSRIRITPVSVASAVAGHGWAARHARLDTTHHPGADTSPIFIIFFKKIKKNAYEIRTTSVLILMHLLLLHISCKRTKRLRCRARHHCTQTTPDLHRHAQVAPRFSFLILFFCCPENIYNLCNRL